MTEQRQKGQDTRFSGNNFDLIRLLVACQVMLMHCVSYIGFEKNGATELLIEFVKMFPGVPVFFVISGFLISASYERNPNLRQYLINRGLRLYPALIVCFGVSILCISLFGYWTDSGVRFSSFLVWMIAQNTVVQCYNPDFLRGYGVGVINGSLWTISVEVQFYLFVPLFYAVLKKVGAKKRDLFILAVVALFALFNAYTYRVLKPACKELFFYKVLNETLVPHLYLFMLGILFQRNFDAIRRFVRGNALYFLSAYIVICLIVDRYSVVGTNHPNVLLGTLLAVVVLSLAYTRTHLSEILLKKNDISYGVYIYHMVVINCFVQLGWVNHSYYIVLVFAAVLFLAVLSWNLIEKRALKLKRHPLRPI